MTAIFIIELLFGVTTSIAQAVISALSAKKRRMLTRISKAANNIIISSNNKLSKLQALKEAYLQYSGTPDIGKLGNIIRQGINETTKQIDTVNNISTKAQSQLERINSLNEVANDWTASPKEVYDKSKPVINTINNLTNLANANDIKLSDNEANQIINNDKKMLEIGEQHYHDTSKRLKG